jgi:hypothetical protein
MDKKKQRYFAMLCKTPAGRKLRGYTGASEGMAKESALKRSDCLAIIAHEEINKDQYDKVMEQSDQTAPCSSTVPRVDKRRREKTTV